MLSEKLSGLAEFLRPYQKTGVSLGPKLGTTVVRLFDIYAHDAKCLEREGDEIEGEPLSGSLSALADRLRKYEDGMVLEARAVECFLMIMDSCVKEARALEALVVSLTARIPEPSPDNVVILRQTQNTAWIGRPTDLTPPDGGEAA